jgi:aarF domain-containing kinase
MELDFRQEVENARECRELCRESFKDQVVVPAVHEQLSSQRVLTMDFEEGSMLTDFAAIERAHLNPREVAQLLTRVFNEMVFVRGMVHCDPHAGNVLVRPRPKRGDSNAGFLSRWGRWLRKSAEELVFGTPLSDVQLVVLDHGLYRRINSRYRLEYCKLWKSIILADVQGVENGV